MIWSFNLTDEDVVNTIIILEMSKSPFAIGARRGCEEPSEACNVTSSGANIGACRGAGSETLFSNASRTAFYDLGMSSLSRSED